MSNRGDLISEDATNASVLEEPTSVMTRSEPRASGDGVAVSGLSRRRSGTRGASPIRVEGLPNGRAITMAAKRVFDLVAAGLGLVLLAPFLLVIALAIKLDSPGPVLFRQKRVGRGGEEFQMLKFRTMVRDAEQLKHRLMHMNEAAEGLFKISSDPRLTRVGQLLRRTSLDELPQLVHVLVGRMSLVGPRPLVPEEDARIHGGHRRRRAMRPGLTGPWQVAGCSRVPLREMGELDTEYVERWTLSGDFRLILRTVPHVIGRRGI